jgi:hypothetical protein
LTIHVTTRLAAVAVLFSLASCGYESQWGAAKRAQRRVAADIQPATISPALGKGTTSDAGKRSLLLRVRPSGRYLAQTVDAPKRIADLVDDANGVLAPTLAVRLEVERIQPWSTDADEILGPALDALRTDDDGRDVDVVVGMIGALPRQTDSFHELGMATLPGKYLVVRASSRLGERDAIDKGFYELDQDERSRLARVRERHRALAVFLHELGHTLGALHETDARSLMHPSYSTQMTGFAGGAVGLMRIRLDAGDLATAARGQLDFLDRTTSGDWIAADRDEQIRRLRSMTPATPSTVVQTQTSAATAQDLPPDLHGDDRDRFKRATEALRAGAAGPAYKIAMPLFTTYPNLSAVQDLRCQLATVRWLDRDTLKAECAPYVRLSTPADAGHPD